MHEIMKITILAVSIGFSCLTLGQNQNSIWIFGETGLDFSSGNPIEIQTGNMYGHEGTTSICDSTGNLLCYSNGEEVYNSNHVIMQNGSGLSGSFSTTQGTLLVSKPNDPSAIYLFTANQLGGGLYYSVIDMTGDGGLGEVQNPTNVLLHSAVAENILAIPHANAEDIWIICHEAGNTNILVYSLTSSGINMTPAVYPNGLQVESGWGQGCSTVSQDNSKYAIAYKNTSNVQVFDFDNSTGGLTNPIELIFTGPYGVEFSPSTNFLYVSGSDSSQISPFLANQISQFDLNAGSENQINDSRIEYETWSNGDVFAMKIAPNGTFYLAHYNEPWLGVINYPDSAGLACDIQEHVLPLDSANCRFGLPNQLNPINLEVETSINEEKIKFSFFPNPVLDKLIITGNIPITAVKFFKLDGSQVAYFEESSPNVSIDVSSLSNGVYIIRVSTLHEAFYRKIIKL
jgi:hypothetical protein